MSTEVTKQSGYASQYPHDLGVTKQSAYASFYVPDMRITKQTAYITFYPRPASAARRRRAPIVN